MSETRRVNAELIASELSLTTSRSSGPGGQNVNKVNSKVILQFDVAGSAILRDEEKEVILTKLHSKITTDGKLMLSAQGSRSQLQNKEAVIQKLDVLLTKAFQKRKARKATKPSKSSVEKRINKKKQHAQKKKWRQKPI
jgi:ribosome-associated protein